MKRVDELGVSPMPWNSHKQFVIANDDGSVVAASNYNDARLISAAPELYDCLRYCIGIIGDYAEPIGADCETIEMIDKARVALAKAGGEEDAQ